MNNQAIIGLVCATAFSTAMAGMLALQSCHSPKAQQAEINLCKIRAEYKAANAALGGALDPKPGSQREKLEAAEDLLCIDVDAGK